MELFQLLYRFHFAHQTRGSGSNELRLLLGGHAVTIHETKLRRCACSIFQGFAVKRLLSISSHNFRPPLERHTADWAACWGSGHHVAAKAYLVFGHSMHALFLRRRLSGWLLDKSIKKLGKGTRQAGGSSDSGVLFRV
jgi:hypothetical protein